MSRQLWEVAETKISAGPSRVTGPAELIEMVQYSVGKTEMSCDSRELGVLRRVEQVSEPYC
jgi:hypothetical protein